MRIALVYPGTLKEANASLGHWVVYHLLRETGAEVDRFTLDSPLSLRASLPLRAFDAIFASVHYELQLPALLRYLRTQRIPLRKEEREQTLVLGGPAVWNPLPVSNIADGVVIGDAEDVVEPLVTSLLADGKREATAPGYFSTWTRERTSLSRHDLSYTPPPVVTDSAYGKDVFYVEPSRGCGFGCRFCLIGWTERPRRDRKLSDVLDWIADSIEAGGRKAVFFGSDVLGYPHIYPVLDILSAFGVPFSVSSMRADVLDGELLDVLARGGVKKITLAPECASTPLSARVNKKIHEEDLFRVAREAKERRIRGMKLYFIVGLPGETVEDVMAVARLVTDLRRIIPVDVSVSAFVPKPYTPFQTAPFAGVEPLAEKMKLLREKVGGHYVNPKRALLQALISVGDERIGDLVVRACDDLNFSHWMEHAREMGINVQEYLNAREPKWMAYVDTGVRRQYIEEEMERADRGEYTPPCVPGCKRCGVC